MKKERDPTPEEFEKMLNWLAADRDEAGRKYETIRHRLIRIFVARGCIDAERLTDEVMNRVAVRIVKLPEAYEGDPAKCFHGFAEKVYLEYLRDQREQSFVEPPPQPSSPDDEREQEDQCLKQCMEPFPASDRQLVLRYHQHEKRAKIDDRKKMASELGITLSGLRTKIHRICLPLEECVRKCLEQKR